MRKYKVQWAYALDIGTPVIHRNEEMARGEVAHLLGTWIRRRLGDWIERTDSSPVFKRYPELEEGVRYLVVELKRLMEEGLVWDAYNLWEEFYVRFENVLGYPLYVMLGTVIVQGSDGTGLKNLIPLIEPLGMPPAEYYIKGPTVIIDKPQDVKDQAVEELRQVVMKKALLKDIKVTKEQFDEAVDSTDNRLISKYRYWDEESEAKYLAELREGVLRKIFPKLSGATLGAFQHWLVQYADFGGAWHPSHHTNEEMAKGQAQEYLLWLLRHLRAVASMQAHMDNTDFDMAAQAIDVRIRHLLEDGLVWKAYLEYKEFEELWSDLVGMFPLQKAIGTIRVIPTPEAEYVG